ncbi:MAG: hypothetical protein A2840_00245 [Candidatus Buchananbacteria bacterium RIFCSPHIGHO2_01_FULL_47_11b]|uniref:GerMN domain-containing protein n=1 Tax=Candidatus Buchananbacteria bacterium RIFCSPHIGHO2_01_FULL_47_11b TaxID=1797537 RepID=A0A1G1Y5Z4_9BACT|nr:MAG: hypothetical protein A2840_00245 [Candidatus Buchananbacteria bacterium RIFCSPHIGHO2_01_FULL_47_11b]
MRLITPSIGILVLTSLLTGCATLRQVGGSDITVTDSPQAGQVAVIDSNIVVAAPLSNQELTSPVTVSGRAAVPDGIVHLRLLDAANLVMASTTVQALVPGPDWGPFQARLAFDRVTAPFGTLEVFIVNQNNQSEENMIRIPVRFAGFQQQTVTVYFSNSELDPNQIDCSVVYPVIREVSFTPQLIIASIGELLRGPTTKDQGLGYFTSIPQAGVQVQSLEVKDGTVYIDFNSALDEGVAGSCRVLAIRAQITETLKTFSDTDQVVISINGETEEILQP